MKKHEIKKAVDKAKSKHMADVISNAGRSKAYDAVSEAMREEQDEPHATAPADPAPASGLRRGLQSMAPPPLNGPRGIEPSFGERMGVHGKVTGKG